jgi:hypothetical protein
MAVDVEARDALDELRERVRVLVEEMRAECETLVDFGTRFVKPERFLGFLGIEESLTEESLMIGDGGQYGESR